MKSLTLLLTTIFLFSLFGCSEEVREEVDSDDLIERDGLYYKKGSEEPFTGNVVGKDIGKLCCEERGKLVKRSP